MEGSRGVPCKYLPHQTRIKNPSPAIKILSTWSESGGEREWSGHFVLLHHFYIVFQSFFHSAEHVLSNVVFCGGGGNIT